MAAIIGKTGTSGVQQTGQTHVKEKTNKVEEKYTITPKQFVGGLLAGAAAFCGIAYAIKKKPAKITELLEQAKNIGSKNSDEIKKAAKKVSGKVQNVADDAQKVTQKATEVVQDTVDDVAKTASKYKQENLETLDKLGVKFNKGVAEVDGEKFTGKITLKDKKGQDIFLEFKEGKMFKKECTDKIVIKPQRDMSYIKNKSNGDLTTYLVHPNPTSTTVKSEVHVGEELDDVLQKRTWFKPEGKTTVEGIIESKKDARELYYKDMKRYFD